MPDKTEETITVPWGQESPDDLSAGGQGSGNSPTDTGGLDVNGNELGATPPGGAHGRSEAERLNDADQGARKPL